MSQENVEIVRRFTEAFNRGDRDAVEALFHPEVEWHTIAGPLLGVEAVHGRERTLRFLFEQLPEAVADFQAGLRDLRESSGGQVLAAAHYEGRGVSSGAGVEMSVTQLYRFDAGLIVFFHDFVSRAEALEAAGFSE